AHALVGHDDIEERTALGAAARESNNDHDESFGWSGLWQQCEGHVILAAFETRDWPPGQRHAAKPAIISTTLLPAMPLIRPSREGDLPAITAIYAHHVLHGTGTFETEPPGTQEMAARRAE